MTIKNRILASLITAAVVISPLTVHAESKPDPLTSIVSDLKKSHRIGHISNADFLELSPEDVVVFDVRRPIEYQVSHLENAIHLDPRTSKEQFVKMHADKLKDKIAVFYCSVGQRSSGMLSRLYDELNAIGTRSAFNLEGGAFKWHNDDLRMTRDGVPTRDIHPYSEYYAKFVDDKSSIKYE